MSYAIGSCTDWIDALRDLRDFADGTLDPATDGDYTAGSAVTAGEQWTTETNGGSQPNIPSSGSATDGQVYMTGQGGGSDEIHVQFETYRDTSIYGWEIRGATGFDDATAFNAQLQVSSPAYFILNNSSMNVWMYVNGRRMIAVYQSGSTFEMMYAGFINQYPSAAQWPYPLMVGGSIKNKTTGIAVNNFTHSCMPCPAYQACWLRFADGVWYYTGGMSSSASSSRSLDITNTIWPYAVCNYPNPDGTLGGGSGHGPAEVFNPANMWASFSQTTSLRVGTGFTGEYVLWPCTVMLNGPQAVIAGVLDGVYAVYGDGTLSAGDTITVGSDTYDVFTNTWRSEYADFFAILRA